MKLLRPQYLAQPPFEPAPVARTNGSSVPAARLRPWAATDRNCLGLFDICPCDATALRVAQT